MARGAKDDLRILLEEGDEVSEHVWIYSMELDALTPVTHKEADRLRSLGVQEITELPNTEGTAADVTSDFEVLGVEDEVRQLVVAHRDVPPPWIYREDCHPYSIGWRMGGGESYMMAFAHWREGKQFDEATRIAYFRKYPPPARWLEWVIESIWGVQNLEQDDVTVYTPYFDRVEALGFGSKADFERDANDPKWHDD